jgi:hypothetical protein
MTTNERDGYFERLVSMRMSYALHDDDSRAVLSIDDAVGYVDAVMTAIALEEEPEMEIVRAAQLPDDAASTIATDATATRPEDEIRDGARAERVARLARFFDPT